MSKVSRTITTFSHLAERYCIYLVSHYLEILRSLLVTKYLHLIFSCCHRQWHLLV